MFVDAHRRGPGHGLDAAGDDEVLLARNDAHGCDVHGLLAGAAEAVERDPGDGGRPAGIEGGHAGDVHRMVADARVVAHDDVFDVGGVEACVLLERVEHLREDPLRVDVGEAPYPGLATAPGRADAVDNPGFRHVQFSVGVFEGLARPGLVTSTVWGIPASRSRHRNRFIGEHDSRVQDALPCP